jgi:hypothetical protein
VDLPASTHHNGATAGDRCILAYATNANCWVGRLSVRLLSESLAEDDATAVEAAAVGRVTSGLRPVCTAGTTSPRDAE